MSFGFKHNKKRNIGLISEFFSRYIASAIVEKRYKDIDNARKIWDKHFVNNSELQKELSLFNTLYETNLKNKELAVSLLERVQTECKKQTQEKLDKEKLALISEINLTLKDSGFFERPVPEYKSYASIQLLMNAWRGTGFKGNISELLILEETILERILTEKQVKVSLTEELLSMTETEIDGFVLKLVQEKVNKKFNELFNAEQRKIVDLYVFSKSSEQAKTQLSSIFEALKTETLSLVLTEQSKFDAIVRNKLSEVNGMLINEFSDTSQINDDSVGFYLSIAKLKEELSGKENKV